MRGYQELVNVLVVNDLAAGGKACSSWLDGYWWVGKLILRVEAEQACDVTIQRRGADGSLGTEILAVSLGEATADGLRSETDYELSAGTSFRLSVKNNGGSSGDFKVSVTLVE